MSPKLSKPNNAERDWIVLNLAVTRELIADFNGGVSDIQPSLLDSTFAAWLSLHEPDTEDPNPVINAFGIAFGQYLVEQLQLSWTVASDKHGTEMAVHGQPGNILVYPLNLVAKRYTARETGFFVPLFREFQNQIETVRAETPQRPWWRFW
jgi:hypothetical protein